MIFLHLLVLIKRKLILLKFIPQKGKNKDLLGIMFLGTMVYSESWLKGSTHLDFTVVVTY